MAIRMLDGLLNMQRFRAALGRLHHDTLCVFGATILSAAAAAQVVVEPRTIDMGEILEGYAGYECVDNGGTNHEERLFGSTTNPAQCPPPPNASISASNFNCFKTNSGPSCYYFNP